MLRPITAPQLGGAGPSSLSADRSPSATIVERRAPAIDSQARDGRASGARSGRRARLALAVASFFALVSAAAPVTQAAPTVGAMPDQPADAVLLADGDAPAPLVVLLHGDGQSSRALLDAYASAAKKAGIVLLAPQCPAALGCKGSYWQWGGSIAWLRGRIDAVAKLRAIDRDRIALLGWSGGASWIGWRVDALGEGFAGIGIVGGGMAPGSARCLPCPPPVRMLLGDRNPLHGLARDLERALIRCGHAVETKLLPGKDHAGEWAAARADAPDMLAALVRSPLRHCTETAAGSASSASTGTSAAGPSSSAPTVASSEASARVATDDGRPPSSREPTQGARAPQPVSPPRPAGCACEVGPRARDGGASAPAAMAAMAALAAAGASRTRRRRTRRLRDAQRLTEW